MSYRMAFRDVMLAYELDRDRAARLLAKRRAEVYRRIPRVQEIDQQLRLSGIETAKQIVLLNADNKPESLVENLRKQSSILREEKEKLLLEEAIPQNYFTDIYRCELCQDTGYIELERCRCLKQRLINKYYDLSNIQGQLAEENFDTFDLRYYSNIVDPSHGVSPKAMMEKIYKEASNFVRDFDSKFQNLLFYGHTGLGKTFLCNCIAKDLLDRGYTVLYVTAPRIFRLVEDQRFNREESENFSIDVVTDVDLLILDDLGAEFDTVVTSAALFNIINQRLLDKRSTVISTNMNTAEFENHYSDRIVSRFIGNYEIFRFIGDDIRHKKMYGG